MANKLLTNNEINHAANLQAVLKEITNSAIELMLDAELTEHLDYEKNQSSIGSIKRNRITDKKVCSTYCEMAIDIPNDCKCSFEPRRCIKKQNSGIL